MSAERHPFLKVLWDLAIGWLLGAVLMLLVYSLGFLVLMNTGFEKKDAQYIGFMAGLASWPVAIVLNVWRGWRKRRLAAAPPATQPIR